MESSHNAVKQGCRNRYCSELMRTDMPSGTVTFLFTDIEGSTRLLHELGTDAYARVLAEHRRALRRIFSAHGGAEVDTEGDALFYAFRTSSEGVSAAMAGQQELASGPIRVRIGLHTGQPQLTDEGYVGLDVHKGARIAAAAHGGQVVLSQQTRVLVAGDAFVLTDLGEHRVKDFTEPVWIYQLGEERFPPLKTISNTNLPRPVSSFIGRAREVREIVSLLSNGARLITLTGPGGCGKTRVAIEAAAELVRSFPNGVFWVGLASLRDAAVVADAIAQTLGAKVSLADHIGQRELLLLLDNFEQVVDAAPALSVLLRACPHLRMLVTSRELMRIEGEVEYAVPPLAAEEAVTLFSERAQLKPDETVTKLTQRLDNLPLAIELAAARTSVLSPQEILERVSERLDLFKGGRDADPRQRTLRATIGWSYDLLDPDEQALLRRLSVFVGGWTLRAADEIAGGGVETISSLVDKSLIRRSDRRFVMLETIREFAEEQLQRSAEHAVVLDRHMRWYASELPGWASAVRDHDAAAVSFVQSELENARAALTHALANEQTTSAVLLLWSTFTAWLLSGRALEGTRCAEAVLAASLPVTAAERFCVLIAASELFRFTARFDRARELKLEALDIGRPLAGQTLPGGRRVELTLIGTQCDLADLELARGDLDAARGLIVEALSAARAGADPRALSRALASAAWTSFSAGDFATARKLAAELFDAATRVGKIIEIADARILSALCQLQMGDVVGAADSLGDAIRLLRDHPGRAMETVELFTAASQLSFALGRTREAAVFARLTERIVRTRGDVLDPALSRILSTIQEGSAQSAEDASIAVPPEEEALEMAAAMVGAAYRPHTDAHQVTSRRRAPAPRAQK
jgi:predicted ATPase/class 3 adenylate cyclase